MGRCNCEKCRKQSKGKSHDDYEFCYYKCKNGCNKKDCSGLVEKTEALIDAIECKNKKVISDLYHAEEKFENVNLMPIKNDLVKADTELHQLKKDLDAIAGQLVVISNMLKGLGVPNLKPEIDQLNFAMMKQGEGEVFVGEALDSAKCIDGMIDHLECEFAKAVECLESNCNNKPIVLVPEEEDCGCKPKKHCGCEY